MGGQINDENKQKQVSELVKQLVGDRSIRAAARDTGVAASYITSIINGKFIPSADILRKLVEPSSKPQGDVILEDLMIAAGYQSAFRDEHMDVSLRGLQDFSTPGNKEHSEEMQNRYRLLLKQHVQTERMVKEIIYDQLLEKGIHIESIDDENIQSGSAKVDLIVKVTDPQINEWWFEFKCISYPELNYHPGRNPMANRQLLSRFLFKEPDPGRKISIVVNDEEVFKKWINYKLSLKADLSVILISLDRREVLDEVYLSHYDGIEENRYEIKLV